MLSPLISEGQQIPLIHEVHADDRYLLNTIDGEWFEILHNFPWEDYRSHAAAYYDALYAFNDTQGEASKEASEITPEETKEEARQRLLFNRATMQSPEEPPPQILYQGEVVEFKTPKVDPLELAPGSVPLRVVGRKPKCFFGLLKSFLGAALMGFPAEPEQVYLLLIAVVDRMRYERAKPTKGLQLESTQFCLIRE